MRNFIPTLLLLFNLLSCESDSSGGLAFVNYFFNVTYDSVNVFSYDNYNLDSLTLIESNPNESINEIPFVSNGFFFTDSIIIGSNVYQRTIDYYFDYGNGDIDTVYTS